ncbi:MAG: tripartite tricarboxylate transporter permease [Elstera sp.]
MDILANLVMGFGVALSPINLALCFSGALIGTLIGVLPGIGPVATIAMLLPLTFGLPSDGALIMLAGIFYGAQYGGSTTAILVNLPGEASSVITTLDGYQMARQGRAGAALAIAAIGSFVAGTLSTGAIAIVGPQLTKLTGVFASPEYFALMVLGLVAATILASGSVFKAVAMIFVGLFFGMIGSDISTGVQRFTFGFSELSDGLNFVPVAMGLFGIAEIIRNLEGGEENRSVLKQKISGLMPRLSDLRAAFPAILRGTGLGAVLGVLPGAGPTLSAFGAYTIEKRMAKDGSTFGKGDIRGVAAPEAANNAASQTAFIPMLTLGIPPNAVMALMIGAMTMHGIAPGPQVMSQHAGLFWGMIASMWIGNLMLLIINLPLVSVWVQLLRVPYRWLFPAICMFCVIGVYSINNSVFDIYVMIGFGVLGYLLTKAGCETAPMLMGFILSPMVEENFRRSLHLSHGDLMVFVTRPVSGALLALAAIMLIAAVLPSIRRGRKQVFVEE